MKITCNSCGSKYTIADAKVQGKKVKVRCKGCKESILVDGTQLSGNEPAEASDPSATEVSDDDTAPADGADVAQEVKKNVWSVNLSDDDSRDMTLSELVAAWKAGTVTSDAYVWKDGMNDWKPILEVGELKLKLGPAPKKGGGVVSSTGGLGAGKAAKNDKLDDLFGGVDAASVDLSGGQKPAAGGGGKPTGARNDSSVLFSLDSLNQTSDDQSKGPGEADLFGGMSTGGLGGGFASNNMDLLTAPAKDPPPAPAGARLAAPAALTPVSAPPSGKSKMPLIIGAIVAALALGGIAFALGGSGDESEVDEKLAAAQAEAEKAKKEAEEAKKKAAEELKKKEEELKKAAEEAKKKAEEEAKKDGGDKKEEEKKEEGEEKKEPSAAASSSSSSSSKTEKDAPSPAPAAAASGPSFDVGAAKAALSAAAANAAGCRKPGGPTGAGRVQLTFSTSGRVSSASIVSGPFGGTAVGGCVVSAFRGARVPAFSGSPQTVSKSFKVQ